MNGWITRVSAVSSSSGLLPAITGSENTLKKPESVWMILTLWFFSPSSTGSDKGEQHQDHCQAQGKSPYGDDWEKLVPLQKPEEDDKGFHGVQFRWNRTQVKQRYASSLPNQGALTRHWQIVGLTRLNNDYPYFRYVTKNHFIFWNIPRSTEFVFLHGPGGCKICFTSQNCIKCPLCQKLAFVSERE